MWQSIKFLEVFFLSACIALFIDLTSQIFLKTTKIFFIELMNFLVLLFLSYFTILFILNRKSVVRIYSIAMSNRISILKDLNVILFGGTFPLRSTVWKATYRGLVALPTRHRKDGQRAYLYKMSSEGDDCRPADKHISYRNFHTPERRRFSRERYSLPKSSFSNNMNDLYLNRKCY